jgi:hypothetical protein
MSVVQIRIHNTDVSIKIIFFGKARRREGGGGGSSLDKNEELNPIPKKKNGRKCFLSCLKVLNAPRGTFSKSLEIISFQPIEKY